MTGHGDLNLGCWKSNYEMRITIILSKLHERVHLIKL